MWKFFVLPKLKSKVKTQSSKLGLKTKIFRQAQDKVLKFELSF